MRDSNMNMWSQKEQWMQSLNIYHQPLIWYVRHDLSEYGHKISLLIHVGIFLLLLRISLPIMSDRMYRLVECGRIWLHTNAFTLPIRVELLTKLIHLMDLWYDHKDKSLTNHMPKYLRQSLSNFSLNRLVHNNHLILMNRGLNHLNRISTYQKFHLLAIMSFNQQHHIDQQDKLHDYQILHKLML